MFGSSAAGLEVPPPVEGLRVVPMAERHLDQVLEIERSSFVTPWRREHFLFEVRENRWAANLVAERGDRVVAYACVWHLFGELKINNIAVSAGLRRQGVGRWLLRRILREAKIKRCRLARLEVRPSNTGARELYGRHGFVEVGRRKGYYEREQEDAILMEVRL